MTDMNTTPRGPFETGDQAFAASAPMREAVRQADPGGAMDDKVRAARIGAKVAYVHDTLTAAGVELGQHDQFIARWLAATWDPETVVVLLDWVLRARAAANPVPATLERARYSWVLYKPQAGHAGILEAAGSEGTAVGLVDPAKLAQDMLARHSIGADAGDCLVKVYGADERLVAWAQWEDGIAAAYLEKDGCAR
jgi:hypothetical protein